MSLLLRRRSLLASAAAGGFDPLSIGWHSVFYADDITGLVDGDPVAQWDDSSGNGRHASQATSSKRPVYRPADASVNGQASVEFDGVDDGLRTAAFTSISPPWEVVAVVLYRSGSGSRRVWSAAPVSDGGSSSGGNWFVRSNVVLTHGATVGATTRLFRSLINGASSEVDLDGVTVTGNAGVDPATAVVLGSNFDITDNFSAIDMPFLGLRAGALTSQERSDLLSWAQTKYGVA